MEPYRHLGTDWYFYSAMFPYAGAAKEAWEELERQLAGKGLDLGTYRHGSSTNPGKTVTAVSIAPEGVLRARRILRKAGGRDVDILDDGTMGTRELEALINRRVRKAHAEIHRPEGMRTHESIRRGEAGARLHPDGTMDEPSSAA